MLKFLSFKTDIATPPQYDFFTLWDAANIIVEERDIVIITTKILSIHQGNCIKTTEVANKYDLVEKEADKIIYNANKFNQPLTIKGGTFVGSAGIDESNGNGYYILWPKNILSLLHEIRTFLQKKYSISQVGVMTIDSVVLPMRRGTIGRSIGSVGFQTNIDCRDNIDIFGKKLEITTINVADNLAGAASLLMGECDQCKPIVIARGNIDVAFGDTFSSNDLAIPEDDDLYNIFFKTF